MLNGLHILSPFPDLFIYSALGPFILRWVLGFIFINSGLLKMKAEKSRWITTMKIARIPNEAFAVQALGWLELIVGAMLIVGFYTQVAALVISLLTFVMLYAEYKEDSLVKRDLPFYLLTFAIALTLLIMGAGAFAIDLPL
jgi:uncharacterized membrane protein YphA (DoxX/SURF4 family)